MKKLLSVFLIMFIFSSGIAYGGNSNEDAIEISGIEGHGYRVIILFTNPFPMVMPAVFSFDNSGNFTPESFFGMQITESSGYYTQTGSTFTAHCEFLGMADTPHVLDCEGTSILDIFIYGDITLQGGVGEVVISSDGFFFGLLKLL